MFGIDSSEFLLIAVVALLVIGPKDLPRVMRMVGGWVGRGRAMTRHLRSGFDTMMREAELEEMQKQWAQQNADIMAATHAAPVAAGDYALQNSDRHPRESGDPMSDIPTLGPRFRGDDEVIENDGRGQAMTGPRPSPAALLAHAETAEPAIPLEPRPVDAAKPPHE